jgi:type III pantothenate kinase
MRFRSLHRFTAKLPLLEAEKPMADSGKNTKDSIMTGVMLGVVNEIEGLIKRYKLAYPTSHVIITGGDAELIKTLLAQEVIIEADLVFKGLDYILGFQ